MNGSDIGRHPFKTFLVLAAILYGASVSWFVVPTVVRIVIPEVLRSIISR